VTEDKRESRLARWSRRKQQGAEATLQEDLALQLAEHDRVEDEFPEAVNGQDAQEVEVQEPVLTDADMPAIESLTEDSNFSQFMSSGVSDKLRNLALRKMFKAPFFNIRDGLDEYDGDYTSFEKLGDIVTSDMRHQMEIEAQKKLEAEARAMVESEPGVEPESMTASEAEGEDDNVDENEYLADAEDENVEGENAELADQLPETKPEPPPESGVSNK
jgi:hypothetical protein